LACCIAGAGSASSRAGVGKVLPRRTLGHHGDAAQRRRVLDGEGRRRRSVAADVDRTEIRLAIVSQAARKIGNCESLRIARPLLGIWDG
jgi:hypothetical protein